MSAVGRLADFAGTPADLEARAVEIRGTGAEVVKIAVAAQRLGDTIALLRLRQRLPGPAVLMAMGDAGLASRVLAA